MKETLGKFKIQNLLGKGATASVYMGLDPFSERKVAIKVANQAIFNDPVHGEKFRKMFINEASLAGKLRHPHIVSTYDAGMEEEINYIVMEYVQGGTLKDHTSSLNRLPQAQIIEIIFKCANALDYASENGVIHRDIKPANLMYLGDTNVKVTDFGTALMETSDRSQVTDTVGSPAYMSPEQVYGKPLNFQSDIYSLGVVMYQLLCSRLPHNAKTQKELFQKIAKETAQPLTSIDPSIPEIISNTVSKCLEKDVKQRYASWSALQNDLILAHESIRPPADGLSETEKFLMLKKLRFFKDFNDRERWEILRISKWHKFVPGKNLIKEGMVGTSIYILASGNARILKNGTFIGVVEAGNCFGEMGYIYGKRKPRTASVVSNTQVDVIKIRAEDIYEASDALQSAIQTVLLRIMSDRLEKTSILASIV